jgi:hypothetical protein
MQLLQWPVVATTAREEKRLPAPGTGTSTSIDFSEQNCGIAFCGRNASLRLNVLSLPSSSVEKPVDVVRLRLQLLHFSYLLLEQNSWIFSTTVRYLQIPDVKTICRTTK